MNLSVRAGAEVERLVQRTVEIDAHDVVVILAVVCGELPADEQEIALVQLDDVHRLVQTVAGVEHPVHRAVGLQPGQTADRAVVKVGEIAGHDHRAVRHQLNIPDGAIRPETGRVRHIHRSGRRIGRFVVYDGDHRAGVVAQHRAAHHVVEADEEVLVVLQRAVIRQADDKLLAEILRPELERADGRLEIDKLTGRDR